MIRLDNNEIRYSHNFVNIKNPVNGLLLEGVSFMVCKVHLNKAVIGEV